MSTQRPTFSETAPGTMVGPGALAFERLLPGPIERVWDYLTVPELRRTWLADGPMVLTRGGHVDMRFNNQELNQHAEPVPERHLAHAEHARDTGLITACEPPRLLAFTWDDPSGSTEVRFELESRGDKVRLRLTHRRLTDLDMAVSVASGWHTHLDFLSARLTDSPPPLFWTVHGSVEQDYARRLPDASEGFGRPGSGQLFALPVGRWRVVFQRLFYRPIREVWQAACEMEGMDAWYPARLRHSGVEGGWLTQTFTGSNGEPDMTMAEGGLIAYQAPRAFALEQPADPSAQTEDMRHPQTVRIELAAAEDGSEDNGPTLLTFSHEFAGDETAARVMPGWHYCLSALDDALGAGEALGEEGFAELRAWYARWV